MTWEKLQEEERNELQKFNLLSQKLTKFIFQGQNENPEFWSFLMGLLFEKPQSVFEQ